MHSRMAWQGATHCDHDRIPGGREHVRVIIALVVLGELLGEELAGELGTEERMLSLLSLASQVILSCPFGAGTPSQGLGSCCVIIGHCYDKAVCTHSAQLTPGWNTLGNPAQPSCSSQRMRTGEVGQLSSYPSESAGGRPDLREARVWVKREPSMTPLLLAVSSMSLFLRMASCPRPAHASHPSFSPVWSPGPSSCGARPCPLGSGQGAG